jgi:hypothetical protein
MSDVNSERVMKAGCVKQPKSQKQDMLVSST